MTTVINVIFIITVTIIIVIVSLICAFDFRCHYPHHQHNHLRQHQQKETFSQETRRPRWTISTNPWIIPGHKNAISHL